MVLGGGSVGVLRGQVCKQYQTRSVVGVHGPGVSVFESPLHATGTLEFGQNLHNFDKTSSKLSRSDPGSEFLIVII